MPDVAWQAESRGVQVRVNSTNIMSLSGQANNNSFGSYAANEQYNSDFIQRTFSLDPDGNSYRYSGSKHGCSPSATQAKARACGCGSPSAQVHHGAETRAE